MLRLGRRETQHLLPIHNGLSEAVCNLHNPILRLLGSHWIEIHRAGHSGNGREPIALLIASAYLLDYDSHLLLRNHTGGSGYVTSRRSEIHTRIHTLDSLGQQPQLLVLIFGMRNHISRIHSGKRLIIRIFQLGGRSYGKRFRAVAYENAQGIYQFFRQGGSHELGQNLIVSQFRIDDILQTVFLDETGEILGGNDQSLWHKHPYPLPLIIQIVFLEHIVQESQAAGLASQGTVAQTGKPDCIVVGLRRELRNHTQALPYAVVVDMVDYSAPVFLSRGEILYLELAHHLAY